MFDFAGKIRDVDLAKGNFRFAPAIYLKDTLKTIDGLPENNFDEIIKKYVENMKGIQSSYKYEEQSEYDVHKLFDK